jgi:toxin ParE1/3/4
MAQLIFRPLAEQDLDDIWFHIAQDNPDAADRTVDLLRDKCLLLASTPLMGRACDGLLPSLRFFPVGNYLIFYLPIEGGIEVARVLHGAQDIQRYFPYTTLQ